MEILKNINSEKHNYSAIEYFYLCKSAIQNQNWENIKYVQPEYLPLKNQKKLYYALYELAVNQYNENLKKSFLKQQNLLKCINPDFFPIEKIKELKLN